MTTLPRACRRIAATAGLLLCASGCAPAYHAYPCGCVPYHYGVRPPLPYEVYQGCPTPVAECYAGGVGVIAGVAEPAPGSDPGGER
jgi:hypothetical protein